jgi:primase-polymerase (primpol)-like protein
MVADTLDMSALRQWLCWRTEERDGKQTKVPYSPLTGRMASSTNPETWANYEDAVRACKKYGYGGIGFVFTPEDDLCDVDLDLCLDPETGEIEGWAQEVIEELDSYTEISPSGTGVHILVRGELPAGRNRKGRFEAYDRGRYFTVTGKHLPGSPQSIVSRQEELRSVVRRVFGNEVPESTNGHTKPVAVSESLDNKLSNEEIIRKAIAASNGKRFSRLWSGDANGYGSHSEADLALCGMLAFWTGGDAARIETLFRQSGLYREKWDRKDYRNRTITEALSGKTEFYKAPKTVKLADGTQRNIGELHPEEIGKLLSSVAPEEVS